MFVVAASSSSGFFAAAVVGGGGVVVVPSESEDGIGEVGRRSVDQSRKFVDIFFCKVCVLENCLGSFNLVTCGKGETLFLILFVEFLRESFSENVLQRKKLSLSLSSGSRIGSV